MSTCPNKLACPSITLISGVDECNSKVVFISPNATLFLIDNLYCALNTSLNSLLF